MSSTTLTSATTDEPAQGEPPTFIEPDPGLTRRVEASVAADPALSLAARNVEVTVEDGIAHLRGSVESDATRMALDESVDRVDGIHAIRNEVAVSYLGAQDEEAADDRIAFSLQRSLASDPVLAPDAERVTIDVLRGVVTLRGTTSSAEARDTVSRLVESTPGVAAVQNALRTPAP